MFFSPDIFSYFFNHYSEDFFSMICCAVILSTKSMKIDYMTLNVNNHMIYFREKNIQMRLKLLLLLLLKRC